MDSLVNVSFYVKILWVDKYKHFRSNRGRVSQKEIGGMRRKRMRRKRIKNNNNKLELKKPGFKRISKRNLNEDGTES